MRKKSTYPGQEDDVRAAELLLQFPDQLVVRTLVVAQLRDGHPDGDHVLVAELELLQT